MDQALLTIGKEFGNGPTGYSRGQHPNSRRNLEAAMAKPGEVKNPNGRPKGSGDRAKIYERLLSLPATVETPAGETIETTWYEAVAAGQVRSAARGNTKAWKEIQDSLHGKLAEKTEHSGEISFAAAPDLSKLSHEELMQFKRLLDKATAADDTAALPPAQTIDIESDAA